MTSKIFKIKQQFLLSLLILLTPILAFCQEPAVKGLDKQIDEAFTPFSNFIQSIIFFSIPLGNNVSIPIVLIVLILGALFFTLYFGFPNIKYFTLAIKTVRGDYYTPSANSNQIVPDDNVRKTILDDMPDTIRDEAHEGEVTPFQA